MEKNIAAEKLKKRRNETFDPRPTRCAVCGGTVLYGKMTDFGITPFQSGYCYICSDCGRYVATHQNKPKEAHGIPGTSEERKLRKKCHDLFDKMYSSFSERDHMYYKLSKELNIDKEDCHFGYMQKEDLLAAIKVLERWENNGK